MTNSEDRSRSVGFYEKPTDLDLQYTQFAISIPIHVLQYVIHVENLPWAYRTVGIYVHKRTKNLVHV